MLYTIMKHLRNFFLTNVRETGSFKIEDGMISLLFVKEGQYIMIEGSNFNDGAYQYPVSDLTDEEFYGDVVILNPPKEFLELVDDINAYQEKAKGSEGYVSESFGGYSYTKSTNQAGNASSWSDAFKDRLNVWRKI